MQKGDSLRLNGDMWTVVDVAPAPELAEMVAVLLEEEGFVVVTKGQDAFADVLTHLGVFGSQTSYVLVPQESAEAALQLIAETVTDYTGDELDSVLMEQAMLEDDSEGKLN